MSILTWEDYDSMGDGKTYAVLEGTGTLTQGIVNSLLDTQEVDTKLFSEDFVSPSRFALKLRGYTAII